MRNCNNSSSKNRILTFLCSDRAPYFLDSSLVSSVTLMLGCFLEQLRRLRMKNRKYGVNGFFGSSGCLICTCQNTQVNTRLLLTR